MKMGRLLVKNKMSFYGHTKVGMMMHDEDFERLKRLSDRLDEPYCEVVGMALKVLENRLNMYSAELPRLF